MITRREQINKIKNAIHEHVNVRDVVARELSAKAPSGNYDRYSCPFHNERRGQALVVKDSGWRCWGKCAEGGDAIAFIQRHRSMDFVEALMYLNTHYLHGKGGDLPTNPNKPNTEQKQAISEPPSSEWQGFARQLIECAEANLQFEVGYRACDYLEQRGLTDETITKFRLGYIPGHYKEWWEFDRDWRKPDGEPIKVPCGILIPWIADGAVWGLKVRRASGQPKYAQVAGGNIAGCLFNADSIKAGQSVVIVEGEFDCMIAHQHSDNFFASVALGSASNHRINARWYRKLMTTKTMYTLMDGDAAGETASDEMSNITDAATKLLVPEPYKDLNNMRVHAGAEPLERWLDKVVR